MPTKLALSCTQKNETKKLFTSMFDVHKKGELKQIVDISLLKFPLNMCLMRHNLQ